MLIVLRMLSLRYGCSKQVPLNTCVALTHRDFYSLFYILTVVKDTQLIAKHIHTNGFYVSEGAGWDGGGRHLWNVSN